MQPTDFFKYSVMLWIVLNKNIATPVDGLFHDVDVV
jgi:hypothetical protein